MGSFPSASSRSFIGGSSHSIRVIDLAVAAWIVAWIVVGLMVGREVSNLRQLSDTVVTAGNAIQQTGRALGPLGRLPFVGPELARVGGQIQAAGRSAVESGLASRDSTTRLRTLLALSIILIPTIPLAAVYVPLRLSWTRDVRAVRRSIKRFGDDPLFAEFLARRALQHLPYHKLREISPNPWSDVAAGEYRGLAQAELERLGLRGEGIRSVGSRPAA
jgi:hypothetical protein